MNRFENWFYWHVVPRRTRDRTEAQIARVQALVQEYVEAAYGAGRFHETDHNHED